GFQEFLRANGIADPNRVGTNFVYKIPNQPAQAASARVTALERERAPLAAARDDAEARARTATADATQAKADAEHAGKRLGELERRTTLMPWLELGLLLAIALAAGAGWVATASVGQQQTAEQHARALQVELEEKRRAALTERQESAKRVVDLEARV